MAVGAAVGLAWASEEPSPGAAASDPSAASSPAPGASASLGPSTSPGPAASPIPVPEGEPFELPMGASALVEGGLEVTFVAVLEDSRCPANVECVWEGVARISVELGRDGEAAATYELSTHPDFGTEVRHDGHMVSLVDLAPYPVVDVPSPGPFMATLIVTSDGGGSSE